MIETINKSHTSATLAPQLAVLEETGGEDRPQARSPRASAQVSRVCFTKTSDEAIANGDNWDVTYRIVLTNRSASVLNRVAVFDDLASSFGGQFVGVKFDGVISGTENTGAPLTANDGFVADTSTALVVGTGNVNVGDTFEVVFTVTIDPHAIGTAVSGLDCPASAIYEAANEDGCAIANLLRSTDVAQHEPAQQEIKPKLDPIATRSGKSEGLKLVEAVAVAQTTGKESEREESEPEVAHRIDSGAMTLGQASSKASKSHQAKPLAEDKVVEDKAAEDKVVEDKLVAGRLKENHSHDTGGLVMAPFLDLSSKKESYAGYEEVEPQIQIVLGPEEQTAVEDSRPKCLADLTIKKWVVGNPILTDGGNYVATIQLRIENTGDVDLVRLSLVENLSVQLGPSLVKSGNLKIAAGSRKSSSSISVDSARWNGKIAQELLDVNHDNALAAGDAVTVEFEMEMKAGTDIATMLNDFTDAHGTIYSGTPIDHNSTSFSLDHQSAGTGRFALSAGSIFAGLGAGEDN